MRRSLVAHWARGSFARTALTFGMIGLVATQPAWAAVDGSAIKALLAELRATDIKAQKDPAAILAGYTNRLTTAVFGSSSIPASAKAPSLSADEERDMRGLLPLLAKVVAEIFTRRGRSPASGQPNDTGGLGGLFWTLDGGTRAEALKSGGWEHQFSKAISQAMLPPKPATKEEACSAVCKTLARMDEWGYDGSPVRSDWTGSSRINSEGQWAFALWSMEALFVTEAAPLCPSVPKRAQILKGMLDRWIGTGKLRPGTLTTDGKFGPSGLHYSNLLLGRLRTFAAKHPDLAESLPDAVRTPEKVDALHKSVFDRLKGIVKDFSSLNKGLGGSNLELHTLTSFLSGLGPDAKTVMEDILKRTESNTGSHGVCKIPYDPVRFSDATVNPRESAGRCVPFFLAKFLSGGNTLENRRQLLSALENWGDFSADLLFHVPRNEVHAYGTRDQLAPYYYPPTVLPSLSAAQLLVNASKGAERDRALAVLAMANRSAMGAYIGDGRWVHPTSVGGFFGKGGESFATTGPATAMAQVCAANGESGAYAGVSPAELNKTEGEKLPPKPLPPPVKENHDDKNKTPTPLPPPPLRERPEATRTPEEALGERLKTDLPKTVGDAPAFVRGLATAERRPIRDALRLLVRGDRKAPAFQKFRAAAGNPSDEVVAAIAAAFDAEERTVDSRLADPADPINVPWVTLLTDRSISLHRKDQAMSLLGKLRKAVSLGDDKRDEAYALAARWVASMSTEQRQRAAELLERMTLPSGDAVPAAVATNDALVKRILVDAIARHGSDGGDGAADKARVRAKEFARNWNKTLREAVPAVGAIDLNREIVVHEDGGKKMKTRAWIESVVKDLGYDELVRWATSAGGETGEKTLALLAKLDADQAGGKGTPQLALKAKTAASVPVATAPTKTAPVTASGAILDLVDNSGASARTNLTRMLPPQSAVWEHGEFVRPQTLASGAVPRLKFDGAVPHGDDPAPPSDRRPVPPPTLNLGTAMASCVACHTATNVKAPKSVPALEAALRLKTGAEIEETFNRMRDAHGSKASDDVRAALVRTYGKTAVPPEPTPSKSTPVALPKMSRLTSLTPDVMKQVAAARAAGRKIQVLVTHENCGNCRGKPEALANAASADRTTDLFVSLHYPATTPPLRISADQLQMIKALGVSFDGFPTHAVLPAQSGPPPRTPAELDPITRYENLTYSIPGNPPRVRAETKNERPLFPEIPVGGNGKIVVAYFADQDDPEMKRILGAHDLIEVRRYPVNSPEHRHAGRSQVIYFDGLGRKISRSAVELDARQSLQAVMKDTQEQTLLREYLAAKKAKAPKEEPAPPFTPSKLHGSSAEIRKSKDFHGASQACLSCHQKNAKVPAQVKNEDAMIPLIASVGRQRLDEMMDDGRFTPAGRAAIHAFADAVRAEMAERTQAREVPACYGSEAERTAKLAGLPSFVPNTSLGATRLSVAKANRGMMFYGRDSVPRAWQEREGWLVTEKNATNPFMMGHMGYNSDAAREFPWAHAAGTDLSPESASEKFIIPPPSGPIAREVERTLEKDPLYFGTSQPSKPITGWEFTAGTTFGEVLKVKDSETGEAIPFEIRLRTFTEAGGWQMDVLRPFESPQDLLAKLKSLCESERKPAGCARIVSEGVIAKLESPSPVVRDRTHYISAKNFGTKREPLTLSRTADESTQKSAAIHEIPPMPADVVRALLKTTPFKSVFGKPWVAATGSSPAGWAPSSTADFGIVPKNYFAAYIPTTQSGCMKCHDSAGRHVDNFDPNPSSQMNAPSPTDAKTRGRFTVGPGIRRVEDWIEGKWVRLPDGSPVPPRTRTWYNHVPGNRENLSWHPFTKEATERGAMLDEAGIRNECLVKAGLYELRK